MTLHDMTCGIDQGDVIAQASLPLDPSRPVFDLYLDSVPSGADIVLKNLAVFKKDGFVSLLPQQKIGNGYYTNPAPEEFRNFTARGIIYAHPQMAIERMSGLFSAAGSVMQARLKRELQQAVDEAVSSVWSTAQEIKKLKVSEIQTPKLL